MPSSRRQLVRSFGAHGLIALAVLMVLVLGHNAVFGPLFAKPRGRSPEIETMRLVKQPAVKPRSGG